MAPVVLKTLQDGSAAPEGRPGGGSGTLQVNFMKIFASDYKSPSPLGRRSGGAKPRERLKILYHSICLPFLSKTGWSSSPGGRRGGGSGDLPVNLMKISASDDLGLPCPGTPRRRGKAPGASDKKHEIWAIKFRFRNHGFMLTKDRFSSLQRSLIALLAESAAPGSPPPGETHWPAM